MSAARVQSQIADFRLVELPASECGIGALEPPGVATLSVRRDPEASENVQLTLRADRAFDFGFAVFIPSETTSGLNYRTIDSDVTREPTLAEATWSASTTADTLLGG